MPRPPVDTSIPQVPLDPVASPVDTYVHPTVDQSAGSDLMSLARSLSAFSAPLNDYVQAQQQKQAANDEVQAQADFVKNNSEGYADAVQKGLIPASESPAYVNAYKRAQGDVAGQQLELDAYDAYNKSPAKNSLDPNAFSTFMAGFLKDRISTTDPEVLKGLLPRIHATQSALYAQHLQDQDQVVRQGSQDMLGAQVNGAIDGAHAAGLASPDGPNYDAAFQSADQHWQSMVSAGMMPDKASSIIEQTVVEQAISKKDPKILDWFDRKVPGQDYTYKSTPDGQKAYNDAVEKLDVIQRRDKVEAHQAQEDADKAAKNKNEADTLNFIIANPNVPIPPSLIQEGTKYNGAYLAQVLGWQKTVRENTTVTDPTARAEVNRQVMDDPANGPQYVIQGFKSGSLSPTDFQTDYKFAQDVQQNGDAYNKILNSSLVTGLMGKFKSQTAPSGYDYGKDPSYISEDGQQAQDDLRMRTIEWIKANPQGARDPSVWMPAVTKIGQAIGSHITPITPYGPGGSYNPNGAPPAAAQPTDGAAPNQEGQPSGTHSRTWGEFFSGTATTGQYDADGVPLVKDAPGATPTAQPVAPVQLAPQAAPPPAAPQAPPPVPQPAAPQSQAQRTPEAQPTAQEVDTWYKGLDPGTREVIDRGTAGKPDPLAQRAKLMMRMQSISGAPQQAPQAEPGAGAAPNGGTVPSGGVAPSGGVTPDGTPVNKSSFVPDGASSFAEAQTPGQLLDATLHDPSGALEAVQRAVSGQPQVTESPALRTAREAVNEQSLADDTAASFEKALHAPSTYVTSSASLASNPKAASILDFIAGPESRGNYNARYGAVDSQDDLSKYSLGDILKLQDASRRGGAPSTAIGRYQFLRKTLEGLIEEGDIPLSAKFTPQLQDQLGLMLLRRRGLDDWQAGHLTDAQFGDNLAQEWAGLPSISTGRSAYEGDGLNHAGVSVGQTLGALAGARSAPAASAASGSPSSNGEFGPGNVYANIPKTDTEGQDQLAKFRQWNPDPIGMQKQHLAEIQPQLADVVRKAQQDNPYLHFVVGAGLRTKAQQQDAIKWGWSKTVESDHLDGHAVDLWPLDEKGAVIFDKRRQLAVADAMEKAARELGVNLDVGARWKRFKDLPHFALKRDVSA